VDGVNRIEYQRMFEAEERQWWYAGMRAIALGLLDAALAGRDPSSPRLRFLDAGCGTGANLLHLAARGEAVGVDLSDDALRFCRRRGVAVARADLASLPFADRTFDGIGSFDVLYHAWVSDDRAALAELVRLLRPGGLLLVRVPALRILWGAHDEAVRSRHRYTRSEVRALLEGAGLEVLRLSYCNSLLFPLLLVRRSLDRLTGRHGSDVAFLPPPFEWLFRRLLLTEGSLLRRGLSLPLGASVVGLARRPASPPGSFRE
jgi:SAM-dependent methyltransferase